MEKLVKFEFVVRVRFQMSSSRTSRRRILQSLLMNYFWKQKVLFAPDDGFELTLDLFRSSQTFFELVSSKPNQSIKMTWTIYLRMMFESTFLLSVAAGASKPVSQIENNFFFLSQGAFKKTKNILFLSPLQLMRFKGHGQACNSVIQVMDANFKLFVKTSSRW